MSKYAKERTQNRIKGLIETFIGRPRKRITVNQIVGQVKSAIRNNILTYGDVKSLLDQIESALRNNNLYPNTPLEAKLPRFQEVKDGLMPLLQ